MESKAHTQELASIYSGEHHKLLEADINQDPIPPMTIMDVFLQTARRYPERSALKVKRLDHWQTWTWKHYLDDTMRFAASLLALGFEPGQAVNIIGFNSPEWMIACCGCIAAGGISTGVYTTNGAESCRYIADHSEAAVVVVEDNAQLEKYLSVRAQLPAVRAFVVYDDVPPQRSADVYSWMEFLRLGRHVEPAQVEARMAAQRPRDCASLIYTSGTTGPPKAVMLSHDNVTWTAQGVINIFEAGHDDRIVSYLPLSHVAAQMLDLYGPLMCGMCVFFARADALRGSLVDCLKEARPTFFLGVPRVWEKIAERMRAVGQSLGRPQRALAAWAKQKGTLASAALADGRPMPCGFTFANLAVFSQIRRALGLDQCRLQFSGAAPIDPATVAYFDSIFLPVSEVYGMSECCGPQTFTLPTRRRQGSCGTALPGTQLKLANVDASGEGEVCYRGRHIFMGYYKDADATAQAIDADGFLHSGDLGRVDGDGFLSITGRIKELIVTAGGENVPPVPIENVLKGCIPAIKECIVVGDKRKYLSCLFTLQVEGGEDPESIPTNLLAGDALKRTVALAAPPPPLPPCLFFVGTVSEELGVEATVTSAARNAKFRARIQRGVDLANLRATSRAQQIRQWDILPAGLSVRGGELTPTLKLKRRVIGRKYAEVINALYP